MRKKLFRIISIVLLLSLLAGCSVPLNADETNSSTEDGIDNTTDVAEDTRTTDNTVENGTEDEIYDSQPTKPSQNTDIDTDISGVSNNRNTRGDFQSARFGMAVEDGWIYYATYNDSSAGIKKAPIDGGSYSKYNVETIFNPSEHEQRMAEIMGWDNPDFYDGSDIITINNLQVVDNWIYWSSDCAIWRFPIMFDADIFDLELIAIIGLPERPSCTNFYVDGEWVFFACNALEERYDASTALVEHSLCKVNINTKERIVLASATSTRERLGDLFGNDYYTLISIKTVCDDGRIYYTSYEEDNIWYYKDEDINETELRAYTFNKNTYRHDWTKLYSDKNGNLISVTYINRLYDASVNYYTYVESINHYTNANLSDGKEIEDFAFFGDDGYYYTSYSSGTRIPEYNGLYKVYYDGTTKLITHDSLYHNKGAICGDYLYYYAGENMLCRMNPDGGNWEDVSWMIK